MEGLALLLGHLLGDFVFQSDWMAKHKSAKPPGLHTKPELDAFPGIEAVVQVQAWEKAEEAARVGTLACLVHCAVYTWAVFITCLWFLPWWAYGVVFLSHYPVDRHRLARKLMTVMDQEEFATGGFAPWSIIVVDNIIHLAVLFALGLYAKYHG